MAKPYTKRQILTGAGVGLVGILLAACGETRIGPAPVSLVEAVNRNRQNIPAIRQLTVNGIEIIAECGKLTFKLPDDSVYGIYGWREDASCPGEKCYFQEPNVRNSFQRTGLPGDTIIRYRIDKIGQPEIVEGSIKIPSC